MRVRHIEPGAQIGVARGEVVVCLTDRLRTPEEWAWLERLLATTPPTMVFCATVGDHAPASHKDPGHTLVCLDGGRPADLVELAAPADMILLQPECTLPADWYPRLREAAQGRHATATASALTPELLDLRAPSTAAAQAVSEASLRLHPRLLAPGGPCVFVARAALELAGPLDEGFAQRCLGAGLAHVLVDELLVDAAGAGARLPGIAGLPLPGPGGPRLRRVLAGAARALRPLHVMIDARELRGSTTGTHVATLELIGALASQPGVRISVLLSKTPSEVALATLSELPSVALVADARSAEHADVVHRPFQVSSPADLTVLAGLGERLVVTHHDLIAYHNPVYFRDHEAWLGYRGLTVSALGIADTVVFVSEHARSDALSEDLLEPGRAVVVRHGVDHRLLLPPGPIPPGGAREAAACPFMLCLGTDYLHKNRLFALRLFEALRRRDGWSGALVLAGPSVAFGSSRPYEDAFLAARPELARSVSRLGAMSEAEKRWLLEHAALALYPTIEEGFGLIPFEAAAQGTPCLWADGGALGELLPAGAAGIVPWDAAASAVAARALLDDPQARTTNVEAIRGAAAGLRWEHTAAGLIEIYRRTCEQPASPAGVRERLSGLMGGRLSEDAVRLVGPGGALPPEVERPLLALATRRRLAAPLFWTLRGGYAIARARTPGPRTGNETRDDASS